MTVNFFSTLIYFLIYHKILFNHSSVSKSLHVLPWLPVQFFYSTSYISLKRTPFEDGYLFSSSSKL